MPAQSRSASPGGAERSSLCDANLAPNSPQHVQLGTFWTRLLPGRPPLPRLSRRATSTAWRCCSLPNTRNSRRSVSLSARASRRPPFGGLGGTTLTRAAAGVVRGERGLQVARLGLARQRVEMQRHAHQHALPEVADRGHEDRPPPTSLAYFCSSGHVLVLQVRARRARRPAHGRSRRPRSCCGRRRCSR